MVSHLSVLMDKIKTCISYLIERGDEFALLLIDGFRCPETRHRITSHWRHGEKNRAGHWPCSLTGIFSSSSRNACQSPGSLRFTFHRSSKAAYVRTYGVARTRAKPCRPLNRRLIHVNHGNVARRELIWWEVIIGFVAWYRSQNELVSTRAIQSDCISLNNWRIFINYLYINLKKDLKHVQFTYTIFRYSDWC